MLVNGLAQRRQNLMVDSVEAHNCIVQILLVLISGTGPYVRGALIGATDLQREWIGATPGRLFVLSYVCLGSAVLVNGGQIFSCHGGENRIQMEKRICSC